MMNHNDFPKMTDQFDARVRATLDNLPERRQNVRRVPLKRVLSIGIAAALCIGGTAFAVNADSLFPLLFPNGGDAKLAPFVSTLASGAATDENDKYRMTVESVLFDEAAGTGIVSLHMENKAGDGIMPFSLRRFANYSEGDAFDNIVWKDFINCSGEKDGDYDFNVIYGESGSCDVSFYLNKSRSTENDYYLEGAFVPIADYKHSEPLRLEVVEVGKYMTGSEGDDRLTPALAVTLPEFQKMPHYKSKNGDITLSPIGLRIQNADRYRKDDNSIILRMKDNSELVILDDANNIDQILHASEGSSGKVGADGTEIYDTEIGVLARTFEMENVSAIVINGTEYPLAP